MIQIQILRQALQDLANGKNFYTRQGGEAVGEYFLDSLIADVDSLALYGGIHPRYFGFHRLLAKRFPYAIYYRHIKDHIIVYRILDCRRDPKRIRRDLIGTKP